MKSIYLIGSLRNKNIPRIAKDFQDIGMEPFADWWGAGFEADDWWKDYNKQCGISYKDALKGYAARNVFEFDKKHLDRCDAAILILPAGRSGHLELGYAVGSGKPGFILSDGTLGVDRWDVMNCFASEVFFTEGEMLEYFKSQS